MTSDEVTVTAYQHYCPPVAKSILASGSSAVVGKAGRLDPLALAETRPDLRQRGKMLEVIRPHERVTELKDFSDTGLYVERGVNGALVDCILEARYPTTPLVKQRLS